MSLVLRSMLERGELDVAIVQVFAHEVRPTDLFLFRESLHWVKSHEPSLCPEEAILFLSFDDDCFYRRWALDIGQDGGAELETGFECSSAAGIVAAVNAGLGVALLSARHLLPEMEILDTRLPQPSSLVYVVRRQEDEKSCTGKLDLRDQERDQSLRRTGAGGLVHMAIGIFGAIVPVHLGTLTAGISAREAIGTNPGLSSFVVVILRSPPGTTTRDETDRQLGDHDAVFDRSWIANDLGSLYTHPPCRNVQRCQSRLDQRGNFQVVETDDGHGIRDADPLFGTIS